MSNLNFDDERIKITPMLLYMDYIGLRFTKFLKENFKEVTPTDFTYLVNIMYHQNISQKELSEVLFVSEASVAQIIKKLEKKGLVYREVSDENKSKNVLNLTENGKIIVFSILKVIYEWESKFEENYSDDEMDVVKKILYDYADKSIDYD